MVPASHESKSLRRCSAAADWSSVISFQIAAGSSLVLHGTALKIWTDLHLHCEVVSFGAKIFICGCVLSRDSVFKIEIQKEQTLLDMLHWFNFQSNIWIILFGYSFMLTQLCFKQGWFQFVFVAKLFCLTELDDQGLNTKLKHFEKVLSHVFK